MQNTQVCRIVHCISLCTFFFIFLEGTFICCKKKKKSQFCNVQVATMGEEMILFFKLLAVFIYTSSMVANCALQTHWLGVASGEALFLHWMFLSWPAVVKLTRHLLPSCCSTLLLSLLFFFSSQSYQIHKSEKKTKSSFCFLLLFERLQWCFENCFFFFLCVNKSVGGWV